MAENIKRIDIKEFQEKGYLQELNRQFLHPLGLALEVIVNIETEDVSLGGVWDYRDDPEGIMFAELFTPEMVRKANDITAEQKQKSVFRREILGYVIQPINEGEEI